MVSEPSLFYLMIVGILFIMPGNEDINAKTVDNCSYAETKPDVIINFSPGLNIGSLANKIWNRYHKGVFKARVKYNGSSGIAWSLLQFLQYPRKKKFI